jgi:amidase
VPGKLRVAVSTRSPVLGSKVEDSAKAAVAATADVMRTLGHDVVERDPERPELRHAFLPRWLRGIADDAAAMDDPERLEPRTKSLAAVGRRFGERGLRRAREREHRIAERLNAVFDHCDVLLTPTIPQPPRAIGRYDGRGWIPTTLAAANTTPFTVPWNLTGQPAMSIPAPSLHEGLPMGVQLVGRPSDEATLISLAAQLEAEVGWADRRPPVD